MFVRSVVCLALVAVSITAVFMLLKRAGSIDWSWLWLLSPLWIASAGVAFVAVVVFLVLRLMLGKGRDIP